MVSVIRAASGVPNVPAGFPILFDADMAIIEPAFVWLMEHAELSGRAHASETVRTYGEHLHDWFDSLEQSGIEWREADERVIAAYRNRMLENPSTHTGRPYARTTINARVSTVCRFYGWALDKGLIDHCPFRLTEKMTLMLDGAYRPGLQRRQVNELIVSRPEKLPRPLRADELARLADHLVVLEGGQVKAAGPVDQVLSSVHLPVVLGDDVSVWPFTVIRGDGIGPEIMDATLQVLDALKAAYPDQLDWREAPPAKLGELARVVAGQLVVHRAPDGGRSGMRLSLPKPAADMLVSALRVQTRGVSWPVRAPMPFEGSAQLDQTAVLLDRLVLRTPIDATVLQVGVRVGEFVAAGAKAPVVLGDITRLQIRCDVDEQLATRMREGLPAKGYLKGESSLAGGKDRSIALKFVRIEPFVIPKTSLTGASIERVDTRVLQVIYQFDRPADRVLFVGQQMDVYIDASQNAPGK